MQNKITSSHKLLDLNGRLAEAGWADSSVLEYDRHDIKENRIHRKEWDNYIVISPSGDYALHMSFADYRYTGLVNAVFYDFKNKREYSCINTKILPGGKMTLPQSVEKGSVVHKDTFCEFMYLVSDNDRHLYCKYSPVLGGPLEANIHLTYSRDDSVMSVAAPFYDDETAFYYNQKITFMPASGYVKVDGQTYDFNPETDFGMLDRCRGVWTHHDTWYRSFGSGIAEGKRLGFNIGYGFGDTSNVSENMIVYDGVCHKLDRVFIDMPPDDVTAQWQISSNDKRFEMTFMPFYGSRIKQNLGNTKFDGYRVFGSMSGTVILDDGTKLEVKELVCLFEQVIDKS